MDKKKLQVVGVSFCLGALSALAYIYISETVRNSREQKKFLDSIYGEGYYASLKG